VRAALEAAGVDFAVTDERIIPDEAAGIAEVLFHLSERPDVDLILTTGGTGLAPRDVTPQATLGTIEYEVPGIAEAMRAASLAVTPAAMLSRAVAGVRNRTLIVNLPGSPKGVRETLAVILPALPHALNTLRGEVGDHERPTRGATHR
jgi:molybdenum cofactor synthesis domain-containing protein